MRLITRATRLMATFFAILLGFAAPAVSQTELASVAASDEAEASSEVAAVTHSLCQKDIVVLGENGFHGDGKTIAFKARLVRNLIEKCRFRAVLFESSFYDFLVIERTVSRHQRVTDEMVASAIGAKWNYTEDMKPLVPFLRSAAETGRVTLGGLDDQLGARGMFYSLDQMPSDLTHYLAPGLRESCQERLRQRIWSDYPANSPYKIEDRDLLVRCVTAMKSAIQTREADRRTAAEDLAMISNIERFLARDFQEGPEVAAERDASMDANLRWLARRLGKHTKIIIWTANEHATKQPEAAEIFGGGTNLGARIAKNYRNRAFALGFSAASGSYRWSAREAKPIPLAPSHSLEGTADFQSGLAYLNSSKLKGLNSRQGALYGHKYIVADWSRAFDGILIFQDERPPR